MYLSWDRQGAQVLPKDKLTICPRNQELGDRQRKVEVEKQWGEELCEGYEGEEHEILNYNKRESRAND